MATKEFSQDLMCYFYLAARALPKRIGVSGTDTVRGGAARWRPRLQFRAPRDGYRRLLWNLIMCCMPALTQRPLHTVICNQKENNFVKYWKSLLDHCCRCIILASNHEPLLQNFGQRQVQLYKLHLYKISIYLDSQIMWWLLLLHACMLMHWVSIVLCCYDLRMCPNTKSKASSVEQPS